MIRLIVILIFVYVLYWFVFKVVLPLAVKTFVTKAQNDMQEKMRSMDEEKIRQEGDISITKKKNRKSDEGEYVDYEEVE